MIDLPPDQRQEVERILRQFVPGIEVRAFGSRVNGTAKPHSDLDLVVVDKNPLPRDLYYQLQDAFEESTLPIRVDLLDWQRITPEFRQHIEKNYQVIVDGTYREPQSFL